MDTYGMAKMTIDLPDNLKRSLDDAIRMTTQEAVSPRPKIPLMDHGLGDATIAENVDAMFGEPFER